VDEAYAVRASLGPWNVEWQHYACTECGSHAKIFI